MDKSDLFRTFCHISDYDEAGYSNLHRLIATSSPLVLWSPSSALLRSPQCRVSEESFLRYVEAGRVRIIGRRHWLLDKEFRNSHRWSGSTWNNTVDGTIRAIALNDQNEPVRHQRVRICPDEEGVRLATEHVERDPEIIETLHSVLTGPTADQEMPVAVVANAKRFDDPRALAENVLRDAYNHMDAIALSESRAPFLLAPKESRFHELMASLRPAATHVDTTDSILLAELTSEVVELIRHMDEIQGSSVTLESFTSSEGHTSLVKWLAVMCSEIDRLPSADMEGMALHRLQEDFDRGRLRDDWPSLIGGWDGALGGIGLSASVADAILQLGVCGAIGLATGAVQAGRIALKKSGYAPVPYEGGSQWPFLYTFGKPASGRRHAKLGRLLDDLKE